MSTGVEELAEASLVSESSGPASASAATATQASMVSELSGPASAAAAAATPLLPQHALLLPGQVPGQGEKPTDVASMAQYLGVMGNNNCPIYDVKHRPTYNYPTIQELPAAP